MESQSRIYEPFVSSCGSPSNAKKRKQSKIQKYTWRISPCAGARVCVRACACARNTCHVPSPDPDTFRTYICIDRCTDTFFTCHMARLVQLLLFPIKDQKPFGGAVIPANPSAPELDVIRALFSCFFRMEKLPFHCIAIIARAYVCRLFLSRIY